MNAGFYHTGLPPGQPADVPGAYGLTGSVYSSTALSSDQGRRFFYAHYTIGKEECVLDFFTNAINVLQTLVIALGAGLGVWGVINLLEGYGNDNPGAKSQGMKQLMAGAGVAVVGTVLIPLLSSLFST